MNRDSVVFKPITMATLIVFLYQIIFPSVSLALTGGPSQPETQSFTPASVTELVDPFSGDFSYNIPLIDVGGYPLGLSYNSGISMEQEASWVGLGWNINPGVINRNVRGLPDDFKGDVVDKTFYVKPNVTFGASGSIPIELFGLSEEKVKAMRDAGLGLSVGAGVKFNNYTGVSLDFTANPSISAGVGSKSSLTVGLGLSAGNSGAGVSPSVSFSSKIDNKEGTETKLGAKIGSSFHSRAGLQAVNFSSVLTEKSTTQIKQKDGTEVSSTSSKSMSMVGGNLSFASPSYTPSISNSFTNQNLSLSTSIGTEVYGVDVQVAVSGSYSGQRVSDVNKSSPSFGYLYYQDGIRHNNAVLDFNREKDIGYSEEVKNLPVTSATYDIFSVSGEGIGGSYRLFRNDVGTVFDNRNKNETQGLSLGGPEFAIGGVTKGGLNLAVNTSFTETGKWDQGNATADYLKFRKSRKSNTAEPVYFRKSGEKNALSNELFFNHFGGFKPISFNLTEGTTFLTKGFRSGAYGSENLNNDVDQNFNKERQARNEAIVYYTAEETQQYGMFKKIRNYSNDQTTGFQLEENGTYELLGESNRFESNDLSNITARKGHHISEIHVFSGDGRRYVYSDPIYNFIKKEVTFATNESSDLVSYNPNSRFNAASLKNEEGLDHYFNRVITPAYPSAFMLSAIVSADYLDIQEDGPTDDDLGSYTKFNYTKPNDFKWRIPLEENKASLNEGFKTKEGQAGDNKANYVYGEKEIKYLHSIETKTHVAEFQLEDRDDGFGVEDEDGGINSSSRMKRLKEIRLYSKEDKLNNGNNAIPIKTVHFRYDSSLCRGITNRGVGLPSSTGKLTLKEVYFTYGESQRGKLSPYKFTYGAGDNNPPYSKNAIDRWGNYQPNTGIPDNDEFPYTSQNYQNGYDADRNAAAWNLSEIALPSGGIIKVEYEADDYAYVQNKQAMQMFKIAGFSETKTGAPEPFLYGNTCNLPDPKLCPKYTREYLKLVIPSDYPKPIKDGVLREFNAEDFLTSNGKRIEELYFKMYVNVENAFDKEYVFGYADIRGYTPEIIDGYLTIKMKQVDNCNQVSLATFNLMQKNFPEVVYRQDRPKELSLGRIFNVLLGSIRSLRDVAIGINNSLKLRNIGKEIDLNKSWVRLYNPNGFKKGGGYRVKRVIIDDQWSIMAKNSYEDSQYGQEYDYTMTDPFGQTISSGVAEYEPMLGNEENPFRQPEFYDRKKLLVPAEEYYVETPMGETFFPGASVGYRKITVKNLTHENVHRNASGKTVNEFYTAYDFPTISEQLSIRVSRIKSSAASRLFNLENDDYVAATQGYYVELNDMHGKPKANWVYQEEDESSYSGVEYKYKLERENRIASKDLVIDKTGKIDARYLGVEMDLIADVRHSYSSTVSASPDFNLDAFLIPPLPAPIIIPTVWPTYSNDETSFSSSVMNKVIKRHGLLKETIYHSQKSIVGRTKNLLRDAESGEVLLTETENEFGDALYSFSYPAYWAYDDMSPVYKTMDVVVEVSNSAKMNELLKEGDKVLIIDGSPVGQLCWVSSLNGSNTKFIDRDGMPISIIPSSSPPVVRVLDPINTNQQMQKVGTVVTKLNPMRDNNQDGTPDELIFEEVLQSSATEFTEQASVYCNCTQSSEGAPKNPYTEGIKGLWKPWKEYNYLTQRTQTRENEDLNTRKDGMFVEYAPFWTPNTLVGQDWQPNYNQWIYTAEASIFNPYGKELESKDALGRYSSAIFGYNNALPTAVAKNARYQDIAFDGFEDYGTEACDDDHFSFEKMVKDQFLSDEEAHSGNKSIRVAPAAAGTESSGKYVLRKVLIECK